MPHRDHVPVPGSERRPLPGASRQGASDPDQQLEVTVLVRRRGAAPDPGDAAAPRVARRDAAATLGADPGDLTRVEEFARDHGLAVISSDPARRSVVLSGSVAAMSAAFGVELERWRAPDGVDYRGRTGPVHVPGSLAGVVEGVFGLDDRPQARPHLRVLPAARAAALDQPGYDPREVARLYDFPAGLDGTGETIAMLEFGGGYTESDISDYFSQLGMTAPQVVAVGVDGAVNEPSGDPGSADGEVLLDIEVAGATAPGARIAVYFAPNSERGFVDAMAAAIHDEVNAPSVVSISWGGPELGWTHQGMAALDSLFADAAALGITVCCASGDNGSDDGVGDGLAHTDFPASSPHALACGGTRLIAGGSGIAGETVWNDTADGGGATGGGISDVFRVPPWQEHAGVPRSANPGGRVGRGVPDVSGDADPVTGYRVLVDGRTTVVGGTSAVAPLWAALVARLNQALGRPVGLLNPALYGPASGAMRDIRSGDNGAYAARPGWDACTGLGSPAGTALLAALQSAAGTSRP